MKAVLISIQPKWCEFIASGKKTVEVRKTKPKLETPFKCYIYCTSSNIHECLMQNEGSVELIYACNYKTAIPCGGHIANGKVIGEFVCKAIEEVYQCNSGWVQSYACLSRDEFFDYLGIPRRTHLGYDKKAYGWLISDLVIYDKPKELSEFKRVCDGNCQSCQYAIWQTNGWAYEPYIVDCKPITRPPQSWCYVEELKGE